MQLSNFLLNFPVWESGRKASLRAGPDKPAFEAQNAMVHACLADNTLVSFSCWTSSFTNPASARPLGTAS
jgi:hypothetical protein